MCPMLVKFSWVRFERTVSKFGKNLCLVHVLHKAGRWNQKVSCRSCATTAKICTKCKVFFGANFNQLLFCHSRCRRRRRRRRHRLSSLLLWSKNFATMVTWRLSIERPLIFKQTFNPIQTCFLLALRRWGRFARRNVCDSATEIPYWWRKICPESGQKRWLVDGVVTLF